MSVVIDFLNGTLYIFRILKQSNGKESRDNDQTLLAEVAQSIFPLY